MATSLSAVGEASNPPRRASGRVRKPVETTGSSPTSIGKRKRGDHTDAQGDAQMTDDDVSDEDQSSEEGEPDEEEVREQRKRARNAKASAPKKPAQKKAKVNGTTLAMRPAPAGARKRAAKRGKAVNTQDAEEAGGLYSEVFASGATLEEIAAEWLKTFEEHESRALASATAPTEYPLIAKGKAGTIFKESFSGFSNALLKAVAASGKLYDEPLIIDNLEVWFSTMSSAGNRAFRHTATVASLNIITALAEISAGRGKAAADGQRQATNERNKKNHNKARVRDIDARVKEATQAQEYIQEQLKDWFDTVFIHRYRDVDPAIRRDCAVALVDWIMALPEYFLDSGHLRYLGWVLSDTVAATRGEVVKQLHRLYKDKDKITGLGTFTERFRSRIVEIATSDAESSVRASGIELLYDIRESGLLEPDDIDAVGRLIYDSDSRVRKAVAAFFAENVKDLYNSKTDDLGGVESLEESLPEPDESNFDTPRLQWLMFKSLAEMMVEYDVEDDVPNHVERGRDGGLTLHAAANAESRFTLAADALYDNVDALQDWQGLCGYLLYDHSASRTNGVASDPLSQLKQESALKEREEVILLELVSASVKHAIIDLAESATKGKLTKKQKEELSEEQEDAARHLALVIPKLLKKFGDAPSTAAAVLRIQRALNLPSMRDLRQDSTAHAALLDDIRKQFMSHGTDEVLGPASEAILHAKSYGALDDVTEEKLGMLWEDVINNLAELIHPDAITVRGASETEQLVAISNNLLRITRLAQVSNPIAALEDSSIADNNNPSNTDYQGAIDYIIALIQRAQPSPNIPSISPEDSHLEDQIASRAADAALRYLQWKLQLIMQNAASASASDIPYDELEALATRRDTFVHNIEAVLQARAGGESVCASLAQDMLELHASAVLLKTIKLRPGMRDDWEALVMSLDEAAVTSILRVFTAVEKSFATLANKKLESAPAEKAADANDDEEDVHADPLDDDDDEPMSDSSPSDEDEAAQTQASQLRRENKLRKTVLAEKTLCELAGKMIYAVHAGVDDRGRMKRRLQRNRARLGPNFKELVGSYLDLGKEGKGKGKAARGKAKEKVGAGAGVGQAKGKGRFKSNAIVAEDEVDDEIEDDEEEEEEDVVGGGEEVESVREED
ncbi:STAG domain-containing protein [Neohortaea acidophila]|uniref:STAG domain-containing protein n=1 Tax=Neohortaea acidophila TaxID=245834 RepID=A0A6A6Q2Q2_9PEZI|nr:STAG domain-containing protein [Neohortaea acidophila]KAF2486301.1 STAG domain-containing protein [Neohortaea acidophila]